MQRQMNLYLINFGKNPSVELSPLKLEAMDYVRLKLRPSRKEQLLNEDSHSFVMVVKVIREGDALCDFDDPNSWFDFVLEHDGMERGGGLVRHRANSLRKMPIVLHGARQSRDIVEGAEKGEYTHPLGFVDSKTGTDMNLVPYGVLPLPGAVRVEGKKDGKKFFVCVATSGYNGDTMADDTALTELTDDTASTKLAEYLSGWLMKYS